MTDTPYRIGDATIVRVQETPLAFSPPSRLLPDWDPAVAAAESDGLVPDSMDAAHGRVFVSVHTWLVRTGRHVVLVDTGIGNGKTRGSPLFDHLDTPFLARLAAAGATPDSVTHVLLTHIHTDHVGWNTQRAADGRWVPTFPNARYLVPAAGRDFFESPEGRARPNHDMYADSVQPVIEAGRADFVAPEGGEVLDGFAYHPTPGHSVDHMSIAFTSGSQAALFAGDVLHHPMQVRRTDWHSAFCADPVRAQASRRWALEYASERSALWLSSHFAATSAGRVTRNGDGTFRWQFA